MRIVVLDADPAFGSESDQSQTKSRVELSALTALGQCAVYTGTPPSKVIGRAQAAEVVLSNKVVLGEAEFAALPSLKLVCVLATGVNVVDLEAAKSRGITVCNVPGYSTASTAQHVVALLLELTNQVGLHERSVKKGEWSRSEAFSYFLTPLSELDGKVMGIVGFGAIGARVAAIAQALGMRVLAYSRTKKKVPGIDFVDKKTLLESSDVVSLHCPLTPETKHFINAEALNQMKSSALLLNAARGPVVDEVALSEALSQRKIQGAAADVLSQEPPEADNALTSSPYTIITPRIAWASEAARERLLAITVENIIAFQTGKPIHVVARP